VVRDFGAIVTLIVVHFHLRPGGIRRVIELAAPHLARARTRRRSRAPMARISRVVLAVGEAADAAWTERLARALSPVPLSVRVEPAFRYLAEQRRAPDAIRREIRRALSDLLEAPAADGGAVWAQNLGVGRNWILSEELARACAGRNVPLLSHHHDWWFDLRWARWAELQTTGRRSIEAAARIVFPPEGRVVHLAINRADADVFQKHCGRRAVWLPNLTEPLPQPAPERVAFARRWLQTRCCGAGAAGDAGAPIWLAPTRLLRRKNLAEALLLTRWLRPGAWLVVTGAASSDTEKPYERALETAAQQHGWPLRLGAIARAEPPVPSMAELLAACEVVLLTSIQEGFGLPFLEAAAAGRPLLARHLPNIAPDLRRFGFRFPHAYEDIRVAPELFDWHAERARQAKAFRAWRQTLPRFAANLLNEPPLLADPRPRPVPFSQLTCEAQLEVLARPIIESWNACAPLNPFLKRWQRLAASGALQPTRWPASANRWLSGEAYARGWFDGLRRVNAPLPARFSPGRLQEEFLRLKLATAHLHPLLWNVPD
jgi:glycosyltransferase involved in cell wall biosynthesis